MTLEGNTVPWLVPWLVLFVLVVLVIVGAGTVIMLAWAGLRRVWEWAWRDRMTPLLDARESGVPVSGFRRLRQWEERGGEDDLPPLPPERTWEQMTSHQLPLTACTGRRDCRCGHGYHDNPLTGTAWSPERERRAPEWETDQRQHYVAMGFDYPSGLMARVRELTP